MRKLSPLAKMLLIHIFISAFVLAGSYGQTPAKTAKKNSAPTSTAKRNPKPVTVTFNTDMRCLLTIDGEQHPDYIEAGTPAKIQLARRSHTLTAAASLTSPDRWESNIDLSKPDVKAELNIELLPIKEKRLAEERKQEEERNKITALLDGRELPVKKLQNLNVSEGDRIYGLTVQRDSTRVFGTTRFYAKLPFSANPDALYEIGSTSFTIVEVQASGISTVSINKDGRSSPAAFVDKYFSVVVVVPANIIPCTLELSRR
jgi:hypothetical protein